MAKQKTKADLEKENMHLKNQIKDLSERIEVWQKECNEKRSEIVKLGEDLRKSENEKRQLKSKLESEIKQLQEEVKEKARKENELMKIISDLACHLGRP